MHTPRFFRPSDARSSATSSRTSSARGARGHAPGEAEHQLAVPRTILEVEGLCKRYGDVVALDGCSFRVDTGRIVGFLGPNGAGKTTAMRCIFGLARPDAGEVRWRGRAVGAAERARFGYMPEERGLYPRMRVGEQLTYFGELSGLEEKAARAAAGGWLDRLGLGDRFDARLEELSHGNQQRVQLAAALVHAPELVVLDEPFSGLDPLGVEGLSQMLVEIAAAGVTVVFASHQLDLVEHVCQDVVIIDHGRVVLAGVVEQLKAASTQRSLTVTVDGAPWVPRLDGAIVTNRQDSGMRILVEKSVDLDDVLRQAHQAGEVTRLSFEPPSLTDLFLQAVSGGRGA